MNFQRQNDLTWILLFIWLPRGFVVAFFYSDSLLWWTGPPTNVMSLEASTTYKDQNWWISCLLSYSKTGASGNFSPWEVPRCIITWWCFGLAIWPTRSFVRCRQTPPSWRPADAPEGPTPHFSDRIEPDSTCRGTGICQNPVLLRLY